jgi:inner membrane protein
LKNEVKLQWNKKENPISGSEFVDPHFGNGIVAQIPLEMNNLMENSFQVNLKLNGSENLDFIALGKNNKVNVISKWANPSFSGSFLPDKRKISKDGFDASWSISHLNRNLPAHWEDNEFPVFTEGKFGLNLINPNDNYQKSERSIKYAILIIALTFLAFFFVELLSHQRIHPFQYLLVGFALCIFYILLISFSEIMLFNLAYFLGSIMTLGLVFFYSKSIFNKPSISILVTAILTVLYLFIFVIIQLQDTALLIGSLGLFIILAITMFVSRRINWQNDAE